MVCWPPSLRRVTRRRGRRGWKRKRGCWRNVLHALATRRAGCASRLLRALALAWALPLPGAASARRCACACAPVSRCGWRRHGASCFPCSPCTAFAKPSPAGLARRGSSSPRGAALPREETAGVCTGSASGLGTGCASGARGSTRSSCEFGASGCCCPRAARRGACEARSFLLFSGGAGRGSARAGVASSDSRPPRSSRHALTGRLDEHRDGARLKPLTFWCGTRAVTSAFGEPERLGLSPASSLASPTHYHRGTRRDWPRERAFAPAVLTVARSLLLSCRRPPCTSGAQNGSRRASAWRHCRASYALSVSRFGSVLRVLPTLLATRRRRGDVHRSYSTFSLRSQA